MHAFFILQAYCVLEEKQHKYLIGVSVGVDVVLLLIMLGKLIIIFIFRKRYIFNYFMFEQGKNKSVISSPIIIIYILYFIHKREQSQK